MQSPEWHRHCRFPEANKRMNSDTTALRYHILMASPLKQQKKELPKPTHLHNLAKRTQSVFSESDFSRIYVNECIWICTPYSHRIVLSATVSWKQKYDHGAGAHNIIVNVAHYVQTQSFHLSSMKLYGITITAFLWALWSSFLNCPKYSFHHFVV